MCNTILSTHDGEALCVIDVCGDCSTRSTSAQEGVLGRVSVVYRLVCLCVVIIVSISYVLQAWLSVSNTYR